MTASNTTASFEFKTDKPSPITSTTYSSKIPWIPETEKESVEVENSAGALEYPSSGSLEKAQQCYSNNSRNPNPPPNANHTRLDSSAPEVIVGQRDDPPRVAISLIDLFFTSRRLQPFSAESVHEQHPRRPTLAYKIQIPTRTTLMSSGFPYPYTLSSFDITVQDWLLFTGSITDCGKLSPGDKKLALCVGIGGGLILGGTAGRRIRKAVIRKIVAGKLARALKGDEFGSGPGELTEMLERWNREFFSERGMVVRIVLPGKGAEDAAIVDEDGELASGGAWSSGKVKESGSTWEGVKRKYDQRQVASSCRVFITPILAAELGPTLVTELEAPCIFAELE